MYEKEMLNEIAQRLPVEDVPLTIDWKEKFENLEVKNENLRLTIAEKWDELQSRKEDGLPIDVSILEELLNDIYHRAYPPPQPNSGEEESSSSSEEESSSSSEEGHDDLDDTTEKAKLQQTAATQVLGNIEAEIGSLRDRQGASLEEMLSNMQFMPLVCELPSLKELHTVPMEKLIDLAIHGKGIYTDEYSKYLQDEIMGDPYPSLGTLSLEYPSTGSLPSLEKMQSSQIFDKFYAKDLDLPSQVSRPTFDLGLGPSDQNGEVVQQPAINLGAPDPPQIHLAAAPAHNEALVARGASDQAQKDPSDEQAQIDTAPTLNEASAIVLAAAEQARLKADLQQPEQEGTRKHWDPIPFNEVERKKKMKNDRKQQPTKQLQSLPVLHAEKAEEARLKKNMSAEKANAYAETLQLLSEL
ncbi:hypothetical protein C5167_040032 [Papaver somniferum]|uniref:Uncharacterized protein n=1 Tax=Papaver somniferum TaxID=3469 RepID=A0A4Y7IDU3_PAPSO|nr:hypothetical protein C5167_040032 [Papaver somniferum]